MDTKQFILALNQISEEKGIAKEKVIETIEMAIAAAYKKDFGKKGQIIRVKLDPESGGFKVEQIKIVVDESMIKSEEELAKEAAAIEAGARPEKEELEITEGEIKKVRFNEEKHIMIEEAKKIKEDVKPGDELIFPLETHTDFGRIAAQTAKQVVIQRIREAERDAVFEEYKEKEGEVVSVLVQRIEGRNIYFDLGRANGVMFQTEAIPGERYRIGSRLRVYVLAVQKEIRGPSIILSRANPNFVKALFSVEVPEVASGAVEIKGIAREAGSRTKIAVVSNQQGIDAVGSLVGQKGTRVSTVIQELNGEKIDIIEWSDDPATFIAKAMSPAKVIDVEADLRHKEAKVIVPDDQLSLGIGRGGQNVRLAAKLTGWKIDVRSQAKPEVAQAGAAAEAETTETQKEAEEIKNQEARIKNQDEEKSELPKLEEPTSPIEGIEVPEPGHEGHKHEEAETE